MAEAPRSIGYSNQWSNPLFATYGSALSLAMTGWLYGDKQSNPFADQPDQWYRAGRIAFLDRTLTFNLDATSTPVITTSNLGGGKNILVFSRSATVSPVEIPEPPEGECPCFPPVPNERGNYVTLQIRRQDGFIETETAPINNNFGNNGRPFIRPAPEFWLGNQSREFTAVNLLGVAATLRVTFQIALLDTGR